MQSATGCSCTHYKEATKLFYNDLYPDMPFCPPMFDKHCCGKNCLTTIPEEGTVNVPVLRRSTNSSPALSKKEMIDECLGCHVIIAALDLNRDSLCKRCERKACDKLLEGIQKIATVEEITAQLERTSIPQFYNGNGVSDPYLHRDEFVDKIKNAKEIYLAGKERGSKAWIEAIKKNI